MSSDSDIYSRDIWGDLAAGEPMMDPNEARRLACLRKSDPRHPGRTRQPDLCTFYRWTKPGARPAGGGPRVILEHVQQAGRRCTTRSAVLRFLHRLSGSAGRMPDAAAASRAHREAERRLAAQGF